MLLGTLLLSKYTRFWAAVLATTFFTAPIVEGLKTRGLEGVVGDGLYFCLGAIVLGIEFSSRLRRD
jgi:hypothetical protein